MNVAHVLAEVALVVAAGSAAVFAVLYHAMTGGAWRRTPYGVNVMAVGAAAAVLLAVALAREFVDWLEPHLDWFRLAAFLVVAAIFLQRIVLLIRAQREPHQEE